MRSRVKHTLAPLAILAAIVIGHASRAATPDEAVALCDRLASHPLDTGRQTAPVPDEQFATGAAITACEQAAKARPDLGRIWFQLGRSYWLADRDDEAFAAFLEAAKRNYVLAMKFIGDAYSQGRGLPNGAKQDIYVALEWYKKARAAGFRAADADIKTINEVIATSVFHPELFQGGSYLQLVYDGQFDKVRDPIYFYAYLTAFVERLRSETVTFLDQDCPGLNRPLNNTILGFAGVASYIQLLEKDGLLPGLASMLFSDWAKQQGESDAITFMKHYKCSNPIVKRVIENVALSYKQIEKAIEVTAKAMSAPKVEARARAASTCQKTVDRAEFCNCAINGLTAARITDEQWEVLAGNFHSIGTIGRDIPSAMAAVRACYKTPT